MFDETEMFAIVMEPDPGGELLDKVVNVCEKETFRVEETKFILRTGKSFVDIISSPK